MKTIDIKGKKYVPVNERLKAFRENYKDWSLISEIVSITEDSVVMVAKVFDSEGELRGVGHAQEFRTSSNINKTSFVENCETSAWGRALGCIGIGIDESVATADELQNEIVREETMRQPINQAAVDALLDKLIEKNVTEDKILSRYKVKALDELNNEQWTQAMRILDKQ